MVNTKLTLNKSVSMVPWRQLCFPLIVSFLKCPFHSMLLNPQIKKNKDKRNMTGTITKSENLQNSLGTPASSCYTISISFIYYHEVWFSSFRKWMSSTISTSSMKSFSVPHLLGHSGLPYWKADAQHAKDQRENDAVSYSREGVWITNQEKTTLRGICVALISRSRNGDNCLEQEKLFHPSIPTLLNLLQTSQGSRIIAPKWCP